MCRYLEPGRQQRRRGRSWASRRSCSSTVSLPRPGSSHCTPGNRSGPRLRCRSGTVCWPWAETGRQPATSKQNHTSARTIQIDAKSRAISLNDATYAIPSCTDESCTPLRQISSTADESRLRGERTDVSSQLSSKVPPHIFAARCSRRRTLMHKIWSFNAGAGLKYHLGHCQGGNEHCEGPHGRCLLVFEGRGKALIQCCRQRTIHKAIHTQDTRVCTRQRLIFADDSCSDSLSLGRVAGASPKMTQRHHWTACRCIAKPLAAMSGEYSADRTP